jgi:hypothetical protein
MKIKIDYMVCYYFCNKKKGIDITDDQRYLIITSSESTANKNRFFLIDLENIEFEENKFFKVFLF